MNQYIFDASVGTKFLFDEEDSDKVFTLIKKFDHREIKIIVPEFFFIEMANICWTKVKRKLTTTEEAIQFLSTISKLPFEVYPDKELSDVALENALRFNISAYDGLYITVAEMYLAPLITADQALFRACHKRFDFIERLGDIKAP